MQGKRYVRELGKEEVIGNLSGSVGEVGELLGRVLHGVVGNCFQSFLLFLLELLSPLLSLSLLFLGIEVPDTCKLSARRRSEEG